ncbi:MAG: hypothetical protein AAGA56_23100 [Myxococcota bacterium]
MNDGFERELLDLYDRGVRLTVAEVARHLSLEPAEVETKLDGLVRADRILVDIDEEEAALVYRFSNLTRHKRRAIGERASSVNSGGDLGEAWKRTRGARPPEVAKERRPDKRNIAVGAARGLALPGVGLFDAAPRPHAAVATLRAAVVFRLLFVPIVGVYVGLLFALASGVGGALYSIQFNREGRRASFWGASGRTWLLRRLGVDRDRD